MKCFLAFWLVLFLQFKLSHGQGGGIGGPGAPSDPDDDADVLAATGPPTPSKHHSGYRKISWCVTGYDEPELHEFPYSQFVPLLRRHNREILSPDVKYDLIFHDIDVGQKDVGNKGKLFKTMHVVLKAYKRVHTKDRIKEIWEPAPLEGVIIQAYMNPYTIALPTGYFFPPGDAKDKVNRANVEIHCTDCDSHLWARSIACRKRTKIHVEHPNILAWHHLQTTFEYEQPPPDPPLPYDPAVLPPRPNPPESVGKQSEVHANFRFYSPMCAPVRRMMFQVLAVRSFMNHDYDIFHRGPYEVTQRDQHFQSDIHPSPYFYFYTRKAICHGSSASDITLEVPPHKYIDFEMNHFYDCCVREEENLKTKTTIELLKIRNEFSTSCELKLWKGDPDYQKIASGDESPVCFFPFAPAKCEEHQRTDEAHSYNPVQCAPCRTPVSTTTEYTTQKPYSIYKRTMHGGLMIMTNFCLQPIVIYIARFYKETFNTKSYKGNKLWYLMHVIGGIVSSSLVYLGYFSGASDTNHEILAHVATGKVYIMTLAICYFTAWGRHKNHIITVAAEFIHGCLGYVTITLALYSVWSAPRMETTSKLFCLLMFCTQAFFMIILSCHICLLDRKIGMKPKRRHFPTVEARFDEVAVPGGKFRIIMLIIFSCITFSLSMASTFVD